MAIYSVAEARGSGDCQAVEVDNSCQSSQAAGGAQLSAGFADTNEPAIEVTSQQGASVSGRLVDARGNGVPNATLCVRERIMLAAYGHYQRISFSFKGKGLLTDRDGDGETDVGGAADLYLGGFVTAGYRF